MVTSSTMSPVHSSARKVPLMDSMDRTITLLLGDSEVSRIRSMGIELELGLSLRSGVSVTKGKRSGCSDRGRILTAKDFPYAISLQFPASREQQNLFSTDSGSPSAIRTVGIKTQSLLVNFGKSFPVHFVM